MRPWRSMRRKKGPARVSSTSIQACAARTRSRRDLVGRPSVFPVLPGRSSTADRHDQALSPKLEVLDIEPHQLRSSKRPREADQQQGPVADALQRVGHRPTIRRRSSVTRGFLPCWAVPLARRMPAITVRTIASAVGAGIRNLMRLRDRRDAAGESADVGSGGELRQVQTHSGGRGGKRSGATRTAPSVKCLQSAA